MALIITFYLDSINSRFYSRLNETASFRNRDGKFFFGLSYPDVYPSSQLFKWKQVDNPFDVTDGSQEVAGFEMIDEPNWPERAVDLIRHGFKGLRADSPGRTVLDGGIGNG